MRRGRGRGGGGRHPKAPLSSAAVDRTPMSDAFSIQRNLDHAFSRRDSDAFSMCSSRPSSIGTGAASHAGGPITSLSDRASQAAALRAVNAYLAAAAIHLRPPLPPAKDIVAAFHHLADRLRYPLKPAAWEDDLLSLLRSLGCPYKVTRSALKAPGTPHSWPPLLSVLYWLTLLCRVTDGLDASPPVSASNDLMTYITDSYYLFLTGEDDAVASLDDDYHAKARAQIAEKATAIQELEKELQDLEAKRSKQMSAPSRLKRLEDKKDAFTADVQKFEAVVKSWSTKIKEKEEALVEKEKELEAKVLNCKQTMAENEELAKQVETQVVNVRDVDRMAREMQAVENDIAKLENANAVLEEKGWELEAALVSKLEEIEGLAELCNQSLRKLKPSIDFQYEVNAKGSSPAEILGTTYKTTLKPALNALANETKRLIISKRDESIDLQKQLQGIVKMLEEKRSHVSVLQAKNNEMTAQVDSLDREIQSHVSRCAADARKMKDELEKKEHHLSTIEKEAEVFLKNSEEGLQAALRETDEETQMCARELLKLIDSIAEYKEFVEQSTAEMKKELYECADDIASLSAKMV
ncbi:kinetochore protein NDC80 homolog [Triticum dicoccoides]|uniref:kinetochore protein NDC80 homolog n=1 Tax=Triticum dicoccoides TaxID=85692 RepID=UPI00188E05B2|nr:kinetochore protein NDC80 homolog [Triticum dicoccoides]